MPIRRAQLTDAAQIRDIFNQNVAAVRLFPQYAGAIIPNWTLLNAQNYVQQIIAGHIEVGVALDVDGVTVIAFLLVRKGLTFNALPNCDEAMIWLIRLNDLTGTAAQKLTKARARFLATITELLAGWFRDAATRNVSRCIGAYPLGGNASALAFLDAMEARNGQASDTTTRPGFRLYAVTPAQGLTGLGL